MIHEKESEVVNMSKQDMPWIEKVLGKNHVTIIAVILATIVFALGTAGAQPKGLNEFSTLDRIIAWVTENHGARQNGIDEFSKDEDSHTIERIRLDAEQGDAASQFALGVCYVGGIAVPQDYVAAAKWVRKAADQGLAEAQGYLGFCYMEGVGFAQDLAEAVKWYRVAADQGIAIAQCDLGNCFYDGTGVSQDMVEAVKWYRAAADQGYARAQFCLGLSYDAGEGVKQDKSVAKQWYRKAAEQGFEPAQKKLSYKTNFIWVLALILGVVLLYGAFDKLALYAKQRTSAREANNEVKSVADMIIEIIAYGGALIYAVGCFAGWWFLWYATVIGLNALAKSSDSWLLGSFARLYELVFWGGSILTGCYFGFMILIGGYSLISERFAAKTKCSQDIVPSSDDEHRD